VRPLAFGASPTEAALVGLTVLIVVVPCALGLATPLAVAAGIRDAARRGIVIVSDAVFEEAADIDTVGRSTRPGTLTDGQMRLLGAETDGTDPATVRKRAAALERASVHPIAEAIVAGCAERDGRRRDRRSPGGAATDGGTAIDGSAARDDGTGAATEPSPAAADVTVTDRGVSGRIDGDEVVVGHRSLFEGDAWAVSESLDAVGADAREAGRVPVYVGWDGAVRGVLVVGDEVREGWEAVVEDLAADGRRVVVLTGDPGRGPPVRGASRDRRDVRGGPAGGESRDGSAPDRDRARRDGRRREQRRARARGGRHRYLRRERDRSGRRRCRRRPAGGPPVGNSGTVRSHPRDEPPAQAEPRVGVRLQRGRDPYGRLGVLNPLFAAVAMGTSSLLVVSNSARAVYKGE